MRSNCTVHYDVFCKHLMPNCCSTPAVHSCRLSCWLLALLVASCTWYSARFLAPIYEVAAPQEQAPAEFACSARCPSPKNPAPTQVVIPSVFGLPAGFAFGIAFCVALGWLLSRRSLRPQTVVERALVFESSSPVPEETEPLLAIKGPITPSVRRQLRALRNNGSRS